MVSPAKMVDTMASGKREARRVHCALLKAVILKRCAEPGASGSSTAPSSASFIMRPRTGQREGVFVEFRYQRIRRDAVGHGACHKGCMVDPDIT